jgi:undecaprenyl diphosphate synthase
MELFSSALQRHLPELQAKGVRLHFMGERRVLPPGLQQQAAACAAATADNTSLLLNVAISYGAQQDMVAAVQALAGLVQAGQLLPEQVRQARGGWVCTLAVCAH